MVFYWSLSDSKSPQVSRTLLSILAYLYNAVVLMASTCPFISKSSRPFINPLVTIPSAPLIIGITVTFMFHSFFTSLERSRYLNLFSLSFSFTLGSAGMTKSTIRQFLSFFFTISWSGRLTEMRWSVCISLLLFIIVVIIVIIIITMFLSLVGQEKNFKKKAKR